MTARRLICPFLERDQSDPYEMHRVPGTVESASPEIGVLF